AVGLAADCSDLDEVTKQLRREERVPARLAIQGTRHRDAVVADVTSDRHLQQPDDLVVVEPEQIDVLHARQSAQHRERVSELALATQVGVAIGADHKQSLTFAVSHDVLEKYE